LKGRRQKAEVGSRKSEVGVTSWNRLSPCMNKKVKVRPAIRYSEAFKMAVVGELEREDLTIEHIRRKYGIRGCDTVRPWVARYGNGSRGKVIRVERPEEINERARLKDRVRRLEQALADANIELAMERAYTRIACEQAGIKDVVEFKKKGVGKRPTVV
jgi:transposase